MPNERMSTKQLVRADYMVSHRVRFAPYLVKLAWDFSNAENEMLFAERNIALRESRCIPCPRYLRESLKRLTAKADRAWGLIEQAISRRTTAPNSDNVVGPLHQDSCILLRHTVGTSKNAHRV